MNIYDCDQKRRKKNKTDILTKNVKIRHKFALVSFLSKQARNYESKIAFMQLYGCNTAHKSRKLKLHFPQQF